MSSVTEDNENQRQTTLKRLKRGDENELERNVPVFVYASLYMCTASLYPCTVSLYLCTASLYLEKVVTSKQLKFAMETDVVRKARLEKMVATTQLRLALETEEERSAKKRNEFNLDLPFFLQVHHLILAFIIHNQIIFVYIHKYVHALYIMNCSKK